MRRWPIPLAATALALAGILWRAARPPAVVLPREITLERTVAELAPEGSLFEVLAANPAHPVRTGSLEPAPLLEPGTGRRAALLAPPPSRVRWRVEVPAHAVLRFAAGVQGDGRRASGRSAVRFVVTIDGIRRWSRIIDPSRTRADRRWIDARVPLAGDGGGPREIALSTEAVDPAYPPAGIPGWAHVRVTEGRRVRRQGAAEGPNLLVLLVDTLRADRLGLYGGAPSPSPTLDGLAARGLVFDQAMAQSSWTLPSVASLFTGLLPRSHGAVGARSARGDAIYGLLADRLDTWPELALAAGVTTVAVTANPLVSGGTNLVQGFEIVEELPWDAAARRWADASEVNDRFLAFLDANAGHRFAAWLHYMEPHDPYRPPDDLRPPVPAGIRPALARGDVQAAARRINWEGGAPLGDHEIAWLARLYDAEITAWDRELGRLLTALAARGVLERTVIVVTSDHGEEFQEHGRLKHGSQLYEESIRVPLVLVGPGIAPRRVPSLAQGIDLAPTALGILGVPVPAALPGHDLRELAAAPPAQREGLAETATGIGPDGAAADVQALRSGQWKLIAMPDLGRRELYDLATDPAERRDLAAGAAETERLATRLDAVLAHAPPPPQRSAAPDPGLAERLRRLGYLD